MIYRADKKLLSVIKSQTPQLANNFYDWNDIYPLSKMEQREYLISLNNLAENGLIYFSVKTNTAFKLTASGLYFDEYCRHRALEYVKDKIVDFSALVVSVIALIISVNAL